MCIYFSGIGGSGLSSLAHIAIDFGFEVCGSDIEENEAIKDLRERGALIGIGQTIQKIQKIHEEKEIYWLVYTSSLPESHPELQFAREYSIKNTKRDVFLNFILKEKNQKLLAICGTHGKTTTTAMLTWLFANFNEPISYLVGSQMKWGRSGHFNPDSEFFVLEADEYDRNFLAYTPYASILTSLSYDHPDTYPSEEDYLIAFSQFLNKSKILVGFTEDLGRLEIKKIGKDAPQEFLLKKSLGNRIGEFKNFKLFGLHNRQNAALARKLFEVLSNKKHYKIDESLIDSILSDYPGTNRRMEKLKENLYSDYAHHPDEIKATIQMASEFNKNVVVVYQPHQNLRQYEILEKYADCFNLAKKVYWLPTYLTRENIHLRVLTPNDIIQYLKKQDHIEVSRMDKFLIPKVNHHLLDNDLVIVMGAGTIDNWARKFLV